MTDAEIMNTVELGARSLLKRAGQGERDVKFRWVGKSAFVNSSRSILGPAIINLPALRSIEGNSSYRLTIASGYAMHEVAHLLYTDQRTFEIHSLNPLERRFLNALEDVRVERLLTESNVIKGAKKALHALAAHADEGCKATLQNDSAFTLAREGRRRLGYPLREVPYSDCQKQIHSVERALDDLLRSESTGECVRIAQRFCRQEFPQHSSLRQRV
jgi:hypothetical protein